jgi:phosphoglycolate phosphatase
MHPARPRLAIFDFDGTLADSWPWFRAAMDETAGHFGFRRLSLAETEALRGQDNRAALRALGVPLWQVPRIAAHLKRLAVAAPAPPLFPEIPDLLRRLSAAGVTLAIASSNTEGQIRRALGPELSGLIGQMAVEASLFGKATRFRRILRATRIPPGEAMAIGDELRDIEAARTAGVAAGAVTWGFAWGSLLAAGKPDAIFGSPGQVAAFFGA